MLVVTPGGKLPGLGKMKISHWYTLRKNINEVTHKKKYTKDCGKMSSNLPWDLKGMTDNADQILHKPMNVFSLKPTPPISLGP